MPRTRRADAIGWRHHVVLKGVAGCDVFRDDHDRRHLLRIIVRHLRECGARCLAWAFLDNHLHLIIETGRRPLSEFVHGFATRYAQYFNWRHARAGHLFQNRFWSKRIDSDEYLRTALAYVHLNLVEAGIAPTLEALACNRWSGHAALLGRRDDPLIDAPAVLACFSESVDEARRALLELMASCMKRRAADPHWRWDTEPAEPSDASKKATKLDVSKLMQERARELNAARADWETRTLRANSLRTVGWTVDAVIAAVCAARTIAPAELLSGSRRRPVCDARALIAHLARNELRTSLAEIGRRLRVRESAVRKLVPRGARTAAQAGVDLDALRLPRGTRCRKVTSKAPRAADGARVRP